MYLLFFYTTILVAAILKGELMIFSWNAKKGLLINTSIPLTSISLYISLFSITWSTKGWWMGATLCLFNFLYANLRKIFAAQKSGGQVPLMLCVCYVSGCVLGAFVLTTVFKNYVQVLRWWNKTLYTGWKAILFLLRPLSCIKRRSHLRFVIIKFHTNNWFEKQHWKTKVAERKTFFSDKNDGSTN